MSAIRLKTSTMQAYSALRADLDRLAPVFAGVTNADKIWDARKLLDDVARGAEILKVELAYEVNRG